MRRTKISMECFVPIFSPMTKDIRFCLIEFDFFKGKRTLKIQIIQDETGKGQRSGM